MSDLTWQEPPPSKGPGMSKSRGRWAEIADALQERPGQWALVHVGAASVAAHIKRGTHASMPAGKFEATSRKRPDGKYDIYARAVTP